MENIIKKRLHEALNNVESGDIKKGVVNYIDSKEFERKISKIIVDRLKNDKQLEDQIVDITKNVITQLYKALWVKRNMWRGSLTNKAN